MAFFWRSVAFSMTQILLARGHEIGLLAVVDTFALAAVSGNAGDHMSMMGRPHAGKLAHVLQRMDGRMAGQAIG
jgi:hypothetical protein